MWYWFHERKDVSAACLSFLRIAVLKVLAFESAFYSLSSKYSYKRGQYQLALC